LETILQNPSGLVVARATLGSLFGIGEVFPLAEKLARIYFVRWLRDGRIFQPTRSDIPPGQSTPKFDQQERLIEALLTVMTHGEFAPSASSNDEVVLTSFCGWVGQWQHRNGRAIASLVHELTESFGVQHIWQLMQPKVKDQAHPPVNQFESITSA